MDMHSALKLGNLPLRIGHWKAIGKKKKINNLLIYKLLVNCGKINKSLVNETKKNT